MRSQTAKGQILTLILLALIGLALIFGIVSIFSARVRAAPRVLESFWTTRGQPVTAVVLGDGITAHVIIQTNEEYVGTIVVKIRKDVRLWFDRDYQVLIIPVDLKGGGQKELELEFTPDEARGGSIRGYFIEVNFRTTRTSWVMENSYPPRLTVTSPLD